MTDDATKQDGPSTLTYLETRLNLLTETIDKLEKHIDQRFNADRELRESFIKGYDEKFAHLEQMFVTGQDTAKRAVDKAEAAQNAHNIASNEWRGTLNDFKSTLIGRPEFERFYGEFSAYRLESARIASMTQGEKSGVRETKETSMAQLGMFGAAVGAIAAIVVSVAIAVLGNNKPPTTPPQVVVVPAPAAQPAPK